MNNFLTMSGNLFVFNSYKCDCKIDKTHDSSSGEPTYTLKIKNDVNSKLRYAFAPQTGLVLMKADGTILEDKILEKFLSIKNDKIELFQKFFMNYGFLFSAPSDSYASFEWNTLLKIIRNLKNTVSLMSGINSPPINYEDIATKAYYLIFSNYAISTIHNANKSYSSCIHKPNSLIEKVDLNYENPRFFIKDETENYYSVPDSIYKDNIKIDYSSYRQIINSSSPLNQRIHAKLTALYANHFANEEDRFYIDFLYNFQMRIAPLITIDTDGKPSFGEGFKKNINSKSNKTMQNALIQFAKCVIRDEINHSLQQVSPCYDIINMSGAWHIPFLLTAMYFSLFYMQTDFDVLRKCANPNCDGYFAVKTTNFKRKYCCASCRNATIQRKHRLKKQL